MIAAPGAAAAAVMPGVRSTPGLPHGGDARGAALGQPDLGEISTKPHICERCISVSVVLPAWLEAERMPILPASLSGAPITTMGSRPGGPTTDLLIVTRPLHPAPRAMMAAPRAMSGPVMPGVRRTPGRLCVGDAPRVGPTFPRLASRSQQEQLTKVR